MPIQIQDARSTDALRRAFGFVGRLVPRLDETISPVAVAADLSLEVSPGLVRRAVVRGDVLAGGAGAFGTYRFQAPGGVQAVITAIWLGSDTPTAWRVAFGTSAIAAITAFDTPVFTDGRARGGVSVPPPNRPSCTFGNTTDVASLAGNRFHLPGNTLLDPRRNEVWWPFGGLRTADGLFLQCSNTNETCRAMVEWLEYPGISPG